MFMHSSFRFVLLLFSALILLTACEDAPPTDYHPKPYVQAFLFIDQPIEKIAISISQPIDQPFDKLKGVVRDADVRIEVGDETLQLVFREDEEGGTYYYPDTSRLVQPGTEYKLRVALADGTELQAATQTPQRIEWVVRPRDVLQYPQDTVNLVSPDSLRISWTRGNNTEFLIRVTVLDTLGYGMYLAPPTAEVNDRTNNASRFEDPEDPQFYSSTRWGYVQFNMVPTVWTAFRWYGRNEVAIIAGDLWFLNWFKSVQWGGRSVEYRPQYSNIRGGLGIFASASIITHDTFVLKRNPQGK